MNQMNLELTAPPNVRAYYQSVWKRTERQLNAAVAARKKGFDPVLDVETKPVADLADRCEALIGPPGVAARFRELSKQHPKRMTVIFTLFEEILDKKLGSFPTDSKRVEQAIKTALVLATDGVVIAPLDGVPEIKISENPDKSKYIDIYYAGPIRAAGGTATVLPFILGDFARTKMGLDRYKPTEDEVERYVEECRIYQEEIFSRQYRIKDEEVRTIVRGCPVCINGEPTEDREVSVHRNIARVPNNRVRGGMCLVISEGIALKARKILDYAKTLGLDWTWLEKLFPSTQNKEGEFELKADKKFLEGMAVGRPVFSYPSAFGGFRLRYGRARNMGIMGKGIHPASMVVLDEFIAVATQMKVERPGKAAGMFPVDSIDGPIVRLHSGEVLQFSTADEAKRHKSKIEKILFLGDLLVCLGDFKYSAHPLVPVGYCEEWWALEVQKAAAEKKNIAPLVGSDPRGWIAQSAQWSATNAIGFSEQSGVPLHPKYLYYYSGLAGAEIAELGEALARGKWGTTTFALANAPRIKHFLERLGVPHKVEATDIVIEKDPATAVRKTLGMADNRFDPAVFLLTDAKREDILSKVAGVIIRDKAGTWIGSRMGRPEAAKARQMVGNPHVLFPIGEYGGNTRSINKALATEGEKATDAHGTIVVEIARFRCPGCQQATHEPHCRTCGARTVAVPWCKSCKIESEGARCRKCAGKTQLFEERAIDIDALNRKALDRIGVRMPEIVKGVKGLINADKVCEPLEKGILRARHDLHIFRDGTIRFEVINAPLTHFKPAEIGLSVEDAKNLGYRFDARGNELSDPTQVCELLPQDVVVPFACGDFFVKVCQFVDEELVRLYGRTPFFNYTDRAQLVGELVLGLAPHTSAAIVGRVIGYTHAHACFAHPYFHMTKRRNIDGDQDSLMLLMDGLLNFSNAYLGANRGGRMDAPLVFTVALSPSEIDSEVYDMETAWDYSLEVYEQAQSFGPAGIKGIERVENRLKTPGQYAGFGYTHETTGFDAGPSASKYVTLGSMEEKLRTQVILQNKIAAVDGRDALENVMTSHLLPDIIGNTRAFSRQTFRCTNCNEKMRRIPLNGRCTKCGQAKIILTIAQGSVSKYLEIAKKFILEYQLSDYLRQRIELAEEEIASVFQSPKKEQKSLFEYL